MSCQHLGNGPSRYFQFHTVNASEPTPRTTQGYRKDVHPTAQPSQAGKVQLAWALAGSPHFLILESEMFQRASSSLI